MRVCTASWHTEWEGPFPVAPGQGSDPVGSYGRAGGPHFFDKPARRVNEFGHLCLEPVSVDPGTASLRPHSRSSPKNARGARRFHLVLLPRVISGPARGEHVLGVTVKETLAQAGWGFSRQLRREVASEKRNPKDGGRRAVPFIQPFLEMPSSPQPPLPSAPPKPC